MTEAPPASNMDVIDLMSHVVHYIYTFNGGLDGFKSNVWLQPDVITFVQHQSDP